MMKKAVFILCTVFFFVSCKKEYSYEDGKGSNPDPGLYYIKATINGTPRTFAFDAFAEKTTYSDGTHSLDLMGYASSSMSNLEGIILTIYYTAPDLAAPSTYDEYYPGS